MNRRHAVLASLGAASLAAVGRAARAQTPPVNKTLRIIMGFPAAADEHGGSTGGGTVNAAPAISPPPPPTPLELPVL